MNTIEPLYIYLLLDVDPGKLPARLNMELFRLLQEIVAPNVFTAPVSYDGRKNAFSMYKLQLGPTDSKEVCVPTCTKTMSSLTYNNLLLIQFNVSLPLQGPPPAPGSRPPKTYKIKVTKVAEINTEYDLFILTRDQLSDPSFRLLHRFIEGKQSQDNAVLTAIMVSCVGYLRCFSLSFTCISKALNVVIRMEPNQKYPFNSRSFFTSEGKKQIGGGLELWRGYFQSIRPSANRMYLNIDIATGAMYKAGPLIGLFMEFFKKNDPSAFSTKRGFPERDRMRLQKFVSNMRVRTAHTGKDRSVVIKKLSSTGASNTMFTMRDNPQPISVADYFRLHANIILKFPEIVMVEVCLSFRLLSRCHLIICFSLDGEWGLYPFRVM